MLWRHWALQPLFLKCQAALKFQPSRPTYVQLHKGEDALQKLGRDAALLCPCTSEVHMSWSLFLAGSAIMLDPSGFVSNPLALSCQLGRLPMVCSSIVQHRPWSRSLACLAALLHLPALPSFHILLESVPATLICGQPGLEANINSWHSAAATTVNKEHEEDMSQALLPDAKHGPVTIA